MKEASVFKYENRLSKTLVAKGGMSATQAITAAQAAVELVREPTLAEMDGWLEEIYAIGGELTACDADALARIYVAANRVVAVAGVFDLPDLGRAAYSLCDLVSRFESLNRISRPMLTVHLDGLRLLRRPEEHGAAHREAVLEGLRQVAASLA